MPPAYEILLLNTAIPQIQAAQVGDTYVVPRDIAFSAALTLSAGTANGVVYLNGSKVATTGSALTFDGSSLAVAGFIRSSNYTPVPSTGVGGELYYVPAQTTTYLNSYDRAGGTYKTLALSGSEISFQPSGAERMRLDTSGNLGLGVTPSAWQAALGKVLQIGTGGAIVGDSGAGRLRSIANAYFDGTNWQYIANGYATYMYQDGTTGATSWQQAASGTANTTTVTSGKSYTIVTAGGTNYTSFGAANNNVGTAFTATSSGTGNGGAVSENISFTQAMTLSSDGTFRVKGLGTAGSTDAVQFSGSAPASSLILNSSGNLGVGVTSAGAKIQAETNESSGDVAVIAVSKTGLGYTTALGYYASAGTATAGVVRAANSLPLVFETAGAERARITSGGDFLVYANTKETRGVTIYGTGANGIYAKCTGTVNYWITNDGAGAGAGTIATIYSDTTSVGSITVTASATAYNTSSDYRLKDNQQPLTGSGAFIDALKPKTWTWKESGDTGVGFIAHEVQEVSPSSVVGEKDAVDADGKPVIQAMEYGSAEFIANIIAELQSLRARVAQLEQGN